MKEITFIGHGEAWDSVKDESLCKFVKGEFTTDDPYKIEKLKGVYPVKKAKKADK